jgi:SPX domain
MHLQLLTQGGQGTGIARSKWSILHVLVSGGENPQHAEHESAAHLQYGFAGISIMWPSDALGTTRHFQPKILLTFDDNVAVSAGLSPKTKSVLEDLLRQREDQSPDASNKIVEIPDPKPSSTDSAAQENSPSQKETNLQPGATDNDSVFETDEEIEQSQHLRPRVNSSTKGSEEDSTNGASKSHTIEITLRADSEFFHLLTAELSSIDNVQAQQKVHLSSEVSEMGIKVVAVTKPSSSRAISDMYAWRELFSLYRDASVFFSSTERDHGEHTAEQARERMQWFANQLEKSQVVCISISKLTIRFPSLRTTIARIF